MLTMMDRLMNECKQCGMLVEAAEYHPYAACLMFQGCNNSAVVRANLDAVVASGYQIAIDEGVKSAQIPTGLGQ